MGLALAHKLRKYRSEPTASQAQLDAWVLLRFALQQNVTACIVLFLQNGAYDRCSELSGNRRFLAACEPQRPMDYDGLSERGRLNVVVILKRRKHLPTHFDSQRLKQLLTKRGHAAANHDPFWADQRDHLRDRPPQHANSTRQMAGSQRIAPLRVASDQLHGNGLEITASRLKDLLSFMQRIP